METEPLLGHRPPSHSHKWLSIPLPHLSIPSSFYVLPIPFLAQLSIQSQATTIVEIVRDVICGIYWDGQEEGDGDWNGVNKCLHPRVGQLFSAFMTVQGVLSAVFIFIMYGLINHYTYTRGIKPVLIVLSAILTLANIIFVATLYSPERLQLPLLILWFVVQNVFVGSSDLFVLPCNTHIVRTTGAEQRTSILSLNYGTFLAGGIPAFALGGAITKKYDSAKPIFVLATACSIVLLLYTLFMLPTSPPGKDREDEDGKGSNSNETETESEARNPQHEDEEEEEAKPRAGVWARLYDGIGTSVLQPLSILLPRKTATLNVHGEEITKRNWRLFLLALHTFLASLSSGYVLTCVVVYLVSTRDYRPDDNGYLLSLTLLASAISLVVFVPLVLRVMKPIYSKFLIRAHPNSLSSSSPSPQHQYEDEADEESECDSNSKRGEDEDKEGRDAKYPSTKPELHLTIFAWILEIVSVVCVPYTKGPGQVLCLMLVYGIGAARQPTTRTICVASAPKSESGDVLTATSMIASVGGGLSTLILGWTLSGTMVSRPAAVFWLSGGFGAASILLLLCVRDRDRWYPVPRQSQRREEGTHIASDTGCADGHA